MKDGKAYPPTVKSFLSTRAPAYGGQYGCQDGLLLNATDGLCYGCDDGLVLKTDSTKGYAGCVDPAFECPSAFSALCYGSRGASNPLAGISGYAYAGSAVCTNQITATAIPKSTTTKSCNLPGCSWLKDPAIPWEKCMGVTYDNAKKKGVNCAFKYTTTTTNTYVYTPTACPTTSPWPAWGWKYPCPDEPRPPSPPFPPPLSPSVRPPRPPGVSPTPPPPAPPVPKASQTCTDSLGGACTLVWDALTTAGNGFLKLSADALGTDGAHAIAV